MHEYRDRGRPTRRSPFTAAVFASHIAMRQSPVPPGPARLCTHPTTGASATPFGWGSAATGGQLMNFEKYTDRAKGFVQSAQTLAAARGPPAVHARASAEGAARRPGRPGRRPDPARRRPIRATRWPPSSARWPSARRSRAAAPASSTWRRDLARVFDTAEKIAEKAGDSFVTVERLLLALAHREGRPTPGKILAEAGVTAAGAERRHQRPAQGPHRRQRRRPSRPMTR